MEPLIFWLDCIGVVAFAVTGCLVAARRQVDFVGFALLSIVTGIGGGTLRDMLLGRLPVFWVGEPLYLWLCLGAAAIMFLAAHRIGRNERFVLWADAVGLAVFTVIGTRIGIAEGAALPVCVLTGIMTATFGGIVRDVLGGEPTLILRREVYVTACFCGAVLYWLLDRAGAGAEPAAILSFVATFGTRAAAIRWGLVLPGYGTRIRSDSAVK